MGWQTNYNNIVSITEPFWSLGTNLQRANYDPLDSESLWWNQSSTNPEDKITFYPNKNYIFVTKTRYFGNERGSSVSYSRSLTITTPWGDSTTFERNDVTINSGSDWGDTSPTNYTDDNDSYYISRPSEVITPNDVLEYTATYDEFGADALSQLPPELKGFKIIETDWYFQGYASSANTSNPAIDSEGWSFDDINDEFKFRTVRMGYVSLLSLNNPGAGYPQYGFGDNWIIDNNVGTASVYFKNPTTDSSGVGAGYGLLLNFTITTGVLQTVTIVDDNISFDGASDLSRGQYYLPGDIVSIPGNEGEVGEVTATVDIDEVMPLFNAVFSNTPNKPIGRHSSTNYIARYINFASFNLTLDIEVDSDPGSYVSLYLMTNLPTDTMYPDAVATFTLFQNEIADRILDTSAQFLGQVDSSGTFKFYDLSGDKYLVIIANYVLPAERTLGTSLDQTIIIKNIILDGAYQENDNNEQFLFTNSDNFSEPTDLCIIGGSSNATYSVEVVNGSTLHELLTFSQSVPPGTGVTFSDIFGATGSPGFFSTLYGNVIDLNFLQSKVGNGKFKSGVWENGVWNSGWRVDDGVYEFDDVRIGLRMKTTNTKWRIQITGTVDSVSKFKTGDRVSVGNIIGIDINEKRKLMKSYFTVLSTGGNSIILDFTNTFPLRRIEKDSENHKIKISKNVWLNGGFLNGYFEGIWNNGLSKGFPYITEIYNTHWIDGKYDGGHFYGEYPEYSYIDTYWWSETLPNSLGLTFGATAHGLVLGDLVSIDKNNKLLNPQYDGDAKVIAVVDDYMVVVDKVFGDSSILEGGVVKRRTGTSVIQNFEFFDNNIAPRTIVDLQKSGSDNLLSVYKYNSWIDVKWLNESASNLGRKQLIFKDNWGEFSINNLYGHITEDVLDSSSSFRNSYDLNKTIYSLGTKYEIYEDFIEESSSFDDPFGYRMGLKEQISPSYDKQAKKWSSRYGRYGLNNFYKNSWTFSTVNISQSPTSSQEDTTSPSTATGDIFPFADYNQVIIDRSTTTESLDIVIKPPVAPPGGWPNPGGFLGDLIEAFYIILAGISSFDLDNTKININRNRYSKIEFDLINYETNLYIPENVAPGAPLVFTTPEEFAINFTGLYAADNPGDYVTPYPSIYLKNSILIPSQEFDPVGDPTFGIFGSGNIKYAYPDQNYVYHSKTKNTKKYEYFYNKTKLDLLLLNMRGMTASFDNIKFYEVDKIPFFKYTTNEFVNKGVQVPYQGVAPFIDYKDNEFSFIDNIYIGLDSLSTEQSYNDPNDSQSNSSGLDEPGNPQSPYPALPRLQYRRR